MSFPLEDYVSSVRDFPVEGILFRDISPILQNPDALKYVIDEFAKFAKKAEADVIFGPESRGFVFGCPLAIEVGLPFIMVRKPGKLPGEVVSVKYDLEYGSDEICMHKGAIKPGQRVIVVDDLLATGGTAKATAELIESVGGVVAGFAFVIDLFGEGMNGKERLKGYEVFSLLHLSDK